MGTPLSGEVQYGINPLGTEIPAHFKISLWSVYYSIMSMGLANVLQ